MNDDLSVLLKVILDSSGIGNADISKIEKVLEKYTVNVSAQLDKTQLINSVKTVLPQIIKEISQISDTDIKIDIDDSLIEKSINQVIQDGKRLEKELTSTAQRVKNIQFQLDNGHGVNQYQLRIQGFINDFEKYGFSIDRAKTEIQSLQQILNGMGGLSGQALIEQADKFEQEFKAVKISVEAAKKSFDKFSQPVSNEKITSLIIKIQDFLNKNTAITKEARIQLNNYIKELNGGNISLSRWNEINLKLKETESSMRGLGKLGKSVSDQFKQAADSFSQWLSVSAGIMFLVSQTKNAIVELKELDNILTEISKTSDLTNQELKKLGLSSYDAASTYGRTASDYLSGVQSMSQSGFYGKQGEAMARQSLLAQAAGDMSQEVADKYILATNAAYKFNGEAEKLNAVLDGQNSISNRNSVTIQDMAEAMSEAGTVASSYRVSIEDLSAMIGTIESVTKAGGSEVGNAIKSILVNLQNINSSKIVNTLNAVNASMTEMVNGTKQLRDPISILRDLAKTFNELDESDPLRAEILTNVAGKYQASKLAALLQNMELFDKMLIDYSEGSGSAMIEAQKSATNLSGSINTLSNSWTELVNTFIDSDSLKTGVNILNDLVQSATSLVNILTPSGTVGVGVGLYAGIKNIGKRRMSVRISKSFVTLF